MNYMPPDAIYRFSDPLRPHVAEASLLFNCPVVNLYKIYRLHLAVDRGFPFICVNITNNALFVYPNVAVNDPQIHYYSNFRNRTSSCYHQPLSSVRVIEMREGDTKTLTCTIDGGVPTPLLSWYRQTATGSLIPLGVSDGGTIQYTGEREHNEDKN